MSEALSMAVSQPITDTLQAFKQGVDNLLAKRHYFIQQVLPKLKENQDYYEIKGRKSLAKGGAEKLASIYNLTATFQRDDDTMNCFASVKDLVAYCCTLFRNDQIVGQGRGAAVLSKNQCDVNKTVKMATKSAYIDAVIRSTGLSDIFTQDIEDMPEVSVSSPFEVADYIKSQNDPFETEKPLQHELKGPYDNDRIEELGFIPATDKQRNYLHRLISQRYFEPDELESNLQLIEGFSKTEASERIEELLYV